VTAVLALPDLPAVPDVLAADGPPEARGLARDEVRLMVSRRTTGTVQHATFRDLPEVLAPGDMVVLNTSATRPAAVPTLDGRLVHLSTRLPGGPWLVEVRRPRGQGSAPGAAARPGERIPLPAGGSAELLAPWPLDGRRPAPVRLWLAAVRLPAEVDAYLAAHGRPIRYGYASGAWPLEAYQTVYATVPGSAEMPSAGRAFTPELLTALIARGVGVTPLVLHCGVSSPEAGEPPAPEWYDVPLATADRVTAARAAGRRVVAVGTTVTRALETATDGAGRTHPGRGWTDVVVTPERGVRAVDALLTGWHPPEASHVALLEAVAGTALLRTAYEAAVDAGYRWHEFGDLHLILP